MSEESGHCHNWTGWRMCGHNVHDLRWAELVCIRVFEVAMSEGTRCLSGSKDVGDGAQYSLARRQPE